MEEAVTMLRDMRKRYPEDEGFTMTLAQVQTISAYVEVDHAEVAEQVDTTRPEVVAVHHRGAKPHISYYVSRRAWNDEDVELLPTYSQDGRLLTRNGEPIMAHRRSLTPVG